MRNSLNVIILEDNINTANYLEHGILELFDCVNIFKASSLVEGRNWLKLNDVDLSLIDIGLPDGSGLEFLKEVKKKKNSSKAIIITAFSDDDNLFESLTLGADGYLLKDNDKKNLIRKLSLIKNDEPPLSPAIALKMMKFFERKTPDKSTLSPREVETLSLIANGYTVPEAAIELGLSRQTVATYVKKIYEKLHVSNRAEATKEAIRRGYI